MGKNKNKVKPRSKVSGISVKQMSGTAIYPNLTVNNTNSELWLLRWQTGGEEGENLETLVERS